MMGGTDLACCMYDFDFSSDRADWYVIKAAPSIINSIVGDIEPATKLLAGTTKLE